MVKKISGEVLDIMRTDKHVANGVLFVGIMLSLVLFLSLLSIEKKKLQSEFSAHAIQHTGAMSDKLFSAIDTVKSIAAFYAASKVVTHSEFAIFSKMETKDQPGIQALEWVPRITAAERGEFEIQARRNVMENYHITERLPQGLLTTALEREEYFPVYFIEPVKGNEAAIGYDLASNIARRKALSLARDTGELQVSSRIFLVQGDNNGYGILVFQPIYLNGAVPETIAERRENLAGFGVGVLKITDLLDVRDHAMQDHNKMRPIVFDETAEIDQQLLFPFKSPSQSRSEITGDFCLDVPLHVGERTWNVVHCLKTSDNFFVIYAMPTLSLIAVLLITAAMTAYLKILFNQKEVTRKFVSQLSISERRYRNIVDNTQLLIQTIDAETGQLLFVNNGWSASMGYSQTEALGLTFKKIVNPDYLDSCRNAFKKAVISGQSEPVTTQFMTKEGKAVDLEGYIICKTDENGNMASHAIFTDVTDRRAAEKEKARTAEELTRFIDTANAPIFGINNQGKINEWNKMAEKITGFTKDDVMGHDLFDEFIPDDFKDSVRSIFEKALKGEETTNYELFLKSKSGKLINLLLNLSTRRNMENSIIGAVSVGQDVTESKKAAAQVIQASKLATLGEMATSVAHELNQPLNVIRMAAGNIQRKLENNTADPEYLKKKLIRIEAQTARAAAIIDHMRMFGRKASEKDSALDPRQVIYGAFDLIGEQLRLAEIKTVLDLPENCPMISGHQVQAEQVILNLITNAQYAILSQKGTNEKCITVKIEIRDDDKINIIVEDTGGGIPENSLDRIFEPFYTTKEIGKGTGLGLSVSYGIIRDMGGSITASNTSHGARFEILLPVLNNPEAEGG